MPTGTYSAAVQDCLCALSFLRAHADDYGIDLKPRLDAAPAHVPEGDASEARGKYLANGPANCVGCHTPMDPLDSFKYTGAPFSGANEAEPDPTNSAQEIIAPNLTPDAETGHIVSPRRAPS